MRAKKALLITAGAVAGALAVAAAAAFNSAVQTWAVRRAIARSNGPVSSIDRVSVGIGRASVRGMRVEVDEGVLVIPSAEAELGVVPALLGRGYHFTGLAARGWTLDLTASRLPGQRASGTGYPWFARAVSAALSLFNERADLSLDGVDLEGDVILPDETGRPAGKAHVIIAGGGLGVGQVGRFLCNATAVLDGPSAPVSTISVEATLSANLGASGKITRADLRADAKASGPQFPAGIGLSCAAWVARDAGKASYSVALIRGPERVAEFDAASPDGSLKMAGSWRLNLRDSDLAPFTLGRAIPSFFAAGAGAYEVDPSTGDVHASGKLDVEADRLGVAARVLGAMGHVALSADFDVARIGTSLRVSRLEARLAGSAPALSVRALQSFEFDPASGELKVADPSGDLVGISLRGIPLAWLKGPLPSLELGGGDLRGDFVLRAEEGRLALRTKLPLRASGVSLDAGGQPAARGLDLSAFVLADYAPQGWQFQLAPFEVRSEGLRMFSLEARFGRLAGADRAVKAAGSWSASLPVLLSLPAASALPRLSAGDASGSFEASLGSTREVRVKLEVRNLAAAPGSPAVLPAVTSEVRADFESGGRTTFGIPVHLDYGNRTADLALSGTVTSDSRGRHFDGTLEGTRFIRSDVEAFGALFGRDGALPGAADARAAPGRQPVPFWPAIRGRVALKFEDVSLPRVDLRNVRGTLALDPSSLALEGGSAGFADSSAARVDAQIGFSPGDDRPYALRATVSLSNVDSAPFFTEVSPDRPPAVEGRFDVVSHLTGSGTGPGDLLDRAQGDLRLSSKDGRFRALQTDIVDSIKQTPSKLVGALDSVTSLFGKKSENLATALVDSAKEISEIHYDQMGVAAERGPDMDIRLTEITLIAPEERLSGRGKITYAEGVPVRGQALSVDLEMGARGHLAKILDLVGLLKEEQDPLGYRPLTQPVHLGGTLRSIDQSQWKDMLVQASLRKGSGLFDKLLGR
jgi:hypothetical protein